MAFVPEKRIYRKPPSFHTRQHNELIEMENGRTFKLSCGRDATKLEKGSMDLGLGKLAELSALGTGPSFLRAGEGLRARGSKRNRYREL